VSACDGRVRDRVVLTALRVAALAIVLFCLFRPTLIVRAAVPQQNVLAVLLDDSRSMQIPDWGDGRPGPSSSASSSATAPLMQGALGSFSSCVSSASRRRPPGVSSGLDALTFAGRRRRLGPALDGVREELAGLPRAGVVLVSDGARHERGAARSNGAAGDRAERLPVFTVGVGSERLVRDIQIDRISTPRSVLKDGSLLVDVVADAHRVRRPDRHSGRRGRRAGLSGRSRWQLPTDGTPATARLRVRASDPGPRLFTFRVPPQAGELVVQNNVREALITVRDTRERILYYEGEPRWEMKFLRRAVADDRNLELVVLCSGRPTTSTCSSRATRRAGRPASRDARCALPVSRADSRQHRGGRLHGRSAADDCRLRRSARRRAADARRRAGTSAKAATAARRWPTCCRCSSIRARARRSRRPLAAAGHRAHAAGSDACRHADCRNRSGIGGALAQLPQVTSVNAPLPPKPAPRCS
jgi:hypothetical protein